jgi:bifunctional UDP-N-acetylglucosamine pyrophosphorylase / glucosamine-1-phosphate N-acetyltransferase
MAGLAIIILAAGKGTRMHSTLPKVLHKLAGMPMLAHVLASAKALAPSRLLTVIGPEMAEVGALAHQCGAELIVQSQQLGTGDAVRQAIQALAAHKGPVLILYGDTPLITPATLRQLLAPLEGTAKLAVYGMRVRPPSAYGRLICSPQGQLTAIIEAVEANASQAALDLVNGGLMAFDGPAIIPLLEQLRPSPVKGEYYLTDLAALAHLAGFGTAVVEGEVEEALGVNSRAELAVAEAIMQLRLRQQAMAAGVTLLDPASIYFSADTAYEADVTLHPHVVLGPGVMLERGVEILPFSHLEGVKVGAGARIGPFARLRPGTIIGENCHIGNFVELKHAELEAGVKANHLSYLGDVHIGARTNIGAGTIICNYDGYYKHHSEIGAGVFIGSNSALVAPVHIGDGAVVAAGSVVGQDVPAGGLFLARPPAEVKLQAGRRYHERKQQQKDTLSKTGKT